jgi:hypothetical protein
MNYWELIAGAVLGTVTSIVLAEFYQRRANRELDLRLKKLQELHDSLDSRLQDTVYFSEKAAKEAEQAHGEAWLNRVQGTYEDPAFPYK